jgi:oligopeptide transport system substrate-binding protein
VFVAGCGRRESTAEVAAREGRYLMVLSADPQTLDPQVATGIPEYQVSMALFEGLAVYDPITCEPRPGAAERWEVSSDGLVYTFHLRPNGRWSNGDALTAEDFVYSLRRSLAPALGAEYAYFLHPIKNAQAYNLGQLADVTQVGIRAKGPLTLEITLENPTPYYLALLTSGIYMPIHRASVESAGKADDRSSPWAKPGKLIGNGPFVLQSWQTNQRLVVARNPQYRDTAAVRLNAIHFMPMESADTADRSFRAGQIHVTDALPLSRVPIYREEKRPDFVSHTYLGTSFFYLNVTKPPLTDPRVRRALSLAVDRKTMVERVTRGGQQPAGSFTPPGVIGYQPPLGPIFAPDEARRLLAEAGYPGGAGFPEVEGIYPTSDSARVMLEAMQDMWRRELGINVRVTNLEWKVFLDALTKRDYQIGFMSWIGDYIDPNAFLSMMRGNSGNNRSGWESPAYDALLDRADRTLDKAQRFQLLGEAEKMLMAEQPLVPLWHAVRNYFLHPAVKGFTPNVLDFHPYQHLWLEPTKP